MSKHTQDHIKVLRRRGVPDSDPRMQGLMRRIEKEEQADKQAAECKQMLEQICKGKV